MKQYYSRMVMGNEACYQEYPKTDNNRIEPMYGFNWLTLRLPEYKIWVEKGQYQTVYFDVRVYE